MKIHSQALLRNSRIANIFVVLGFNKNWNPVKIIIFCFCARLYSLYTIWSTSVSSLEQPHSIGVICFSELDEQGAMSVLFNAVAPTHPHPCSQTQTLKNVGIGESSFTEWNI